VRTPEGVLQTYTHVGFQRNRPELCALIKRQVNTKMLKMEANVDCSGKLYDALALKNLELEQRSMELKSKWEIFPGKWFSNKKTVTVDNT
jgi:hypothetical protein